MFHREFNQSYKYIAYSNPRLLVRVLYGTIWRLREKIRNEQLGFNGDFVSEEAKREILIGGGWKPTLYNAYWESYGSFIGLLAEFDGIPTFPHGPMGIFISNSAHIGKKCVIFQQVTIGSNMLKDSKNQGAPQLEDNVYIGAGAKLIGNIHIGKNARIGANCIVVKDVPDNSVAVMRGTEIIRKSGELDNEYVINLKH